MQLREKFKDQKIILASKSPRRKELLQGLEIDFEVRVKDIEESYPAGLQREEIPRFLSRLKARAFGDEIKEGEIVITSDTVVWHQNKSLAKPANSEESLDMLRTLSGKVHEVISAVTVTNGVRVETCHSITKVTFSELREEDILFYVENFKPFDKAGSYGIQEWIGFIGVSKIEGSYFNIVGLPLYELHRVLRDW